MKRLAGFAGLLLAVCAMLELTARVYLFGPAGLDPIRVDSVRSIFEAGLLTPSEHPEIGFELRPNLDTWFKLVRFRTNSRGLRDAEVDVEKADGVFRAAVLGSSFTLPAGVTIEDAYHSRLETRFDRAFAPRRHEFINFAVGAHHPFQAAAVLAHRALPYQPDLILFAVTQMAAGAMSSPRKPELHPLGAVAHPAFDSFFWNLLAQRAGWSAPPRLVPSVQPVKGEELGPTVIDRLVEIRTQTGIPVVIVRLEFMAQVKSPADRRLRSAVTAAGLHYVDTRRAFQNVDPRSLWIYELDPHPNAEAHARFAQVLDTYLVEQGLMGGIR